MPQNCIPLFNVILKANSLGILDYRQKKSVKNGQTDEPYVAVHRTMGSISGTQNT